MPQERLSSTRQYTIPGPPSPLGILRYPKENGISLTKTELVQEDMVNPHTGDLVLDRSGAPIPDVDSDNNPVITQKDVPKSTEEIKQEAYTQALGIFALQQVTDVDLQPGEREFSALRDEAKLDKIALSQRRDQHAEESNALVSQLSSLDPDTRRLADAALSKGLDPENIPSWVQKTRTLQALRRSSILDARKKQDIALLERDIALLESNHEKEVAGAFRKVGLGGLVNRRLRKQDRQVRSGSRAMLKNEEDVAIATLGKGQARGELKDRDRREANEMRNIVSAKGTIISMPANFGPTSSYIVQDVHPQQAQAFVMRTVLDPKDPHKIKGYEPTLDPTTGDPILKEIYIKIEVPPSPQHPDGKALVPVPRDDRYQSGNTRRLPKGSEYCYADGSRIPTNAIGEDSFSYIDDIVELRPHYTGEEVILAMLTGGINTDHIKIRLGDLEDYGLNNPGLIKHDPEELEKNSFVLDSSEVPGTGHNGNPVIVRSEAKPLAPLYDLALVDNSGIPKRPGGHFRRYTHSIDPSTGRPSKATQAQRAREQYWSKIVVEGRMKEGYKKAADQRGKSILGQ
jgi:hypothetical protein